MQITQQLVEQLEKQHKLTLEAADALWALSKGKQPDRDPRQINQDIYKSRSLAEFNIKKLKDSLAQSATS